MIASEPLCDGATGPADQAAGSEPPEGGWTLLPVGALVAADSLGVSVVPTRLEHWADSSAASTPAPAGAPAAALAVNPAASRQPAGLVA
jgi:hypothetical protein